MQLWDDFKKVAHVHNFKMDEKKFFEAFFSPFWAIFCWCLAKLKLFTQGGQVHQGEWFRGVFAIFSDFQPDITFHPRVIWPWWRYEKYSKVFKNFKKFQKKGRKWVRPPTKHTRKSGLRVKIPKIRKNSKIFKIFDFSKKNLILFWGLWSS